MENLETFNQSCVLCPISGETRMIITCKDCDAYKGTLTDLDKNDGKIYLQCAADEM